MELPPGIHCHSDLVRELAGSRLKLEQVLPFYLHRFQLSDPHCARQEGMAISKFKSLDPALFQEDRLQSYTVDEVSLAELIEPPVLRARGFGAYLRRILGDAAEELPSRRIVPDLWFELSPLRVTPHNLKGEVLGLVEVVDSSDITSGKWDIVLELAECLDCRRSIWVCVLRREYHSPYYSCEFLA